MITDLLPASFRGIPFHALHDELEGGRRIALHEYPLQDTPYAEDLGRAAAQYRVEAVLVGLGFEATLRALRTALDTKGPGLLSHPSYGLITVVVQHYSVSRSTQEGGTARVSMQFGEAGQDLFPNATIDRLVKVLDEAAPVWAKAQLGFEVAYQVAGLPALVTSAAGGLVGTLFGRFGDLAQRLTLSMTARPAIAAALATDVADRPALVASPARLGTAIVGRIAALQPLVGGGATGAAAKAAAQWQGYQAFASLAGWGATLPAATTDAAAANQTALATAVAAAAGAAACTCACAALAAGADPAAVAARPAGIPVSSQEILALRADLLRLIDAQLASATDAAFGAWQDLRTAVVNDLEQRALLAPRLTAWVPPLTLPALVIAHRLYGDAGRAAEVCRRNGIVHPGFVPGGLPLEVLSA